MNLGTKRLAATCATLLVLLCSLAAGQEPGSSAVDGAAATAVALRGFICDRKSALEPCELCPLGSYCQNETAMLPCPSAEFFCPLGSVAPIRATQGFFTLPLATNHSRHYEEPCPAGYFCTGGVARVCPRGFYCGEMLTSPVPCGEEHYCEEGSVRPENAKEGWYLTGKWWHCSLCVCAFSILILHQEAPLQQGKDR